VIAGVDRGGTRGQRRSSTLLLSPPLGLFVARKLSSG
jgi:hypothetical protein